MPIRTSEATWKGSLAKGTGVMKLGSGLCEGPFTRASRFEEGEGSNPEELIGAAHAGCYSMYLSAILSADDFVPNSVNTTVAVHIGQVDGAPTIHTIELNCTADVPGIDQDKFMAYAKRAKAECPVSKALAAVNTVKLSAVLTSGS
ncbi:MAG TPA: OsmC family peroxiredoxin [Anaerolineae bacterium]|nr:OsmC family peroxiredoxin [Anaerolineae bacterium]